MDNRHKILGGGLMVALIYIVLMQGCGNSGNGEIVYRDTVLYEVKTDTILVPTKDTVYKTITVHIPVPYIDSTYTSPTPRYVLDDFDEFTEKPQIYEDSISDDALSITFKATVWGFIDKLELGYKIHQRYAIVKTTTIETEVTKKKLFNGFYMGLDVGIGKDGLTHTAPMLEVSTAKFNYNAGFDLMDKSVIFGVRARIGRNKP